MTETAVRFERLYVRYGARLKAAGFTASALDGVDLEIPRGAFAVIVGPSGCGKTTLLRCINRLVEPTQGRVLVEGRDVRDVEPTRLRRGIGYVIQQAGLFPHMDVAANVAVVPRLLGWDRKRTQARVVELLDLVHLPASTFARRLPRELSGGQQQRVGLARALAADPAILLMDEPFGAVDAIERAHLQQEVADLHRTLGKTIVFVTHDVDEALRLADVLVVMQAGRVEDRGLPLRVLAKPATPFVSQLLGADDALRRLAALRTGDVMSALRTGDNPPAAPEISADADARAALALLLSTDADELVVVNAAGVPVGTLGFDALRTAARQAEA